MTDKDTRSRIDRLKRNTSTQIRRLRQFVVEEIEMSGASPGAPAARRGAQRTQPLWKQRLLTVRAALIWIGLAALAVVASLHVRSLWAPDELRYATVAWEMWSRHEWLTPIANGEPVVGLPPMLFWLTHLGWAVFGVSELWMRLVPAFALAGCGIAAQLLAARLWPQEPEVRRVVPMVLIGTFVWLASSLLYMPMLVGTLFILLALHGFAWLWRERDLRVFLYAGSMLGLATLSLGMLAWVYVLPVVLLAPLWMRDGQRLAWRDWYIEVGKSALLALGIFLLWAIPAAAHGGAAYLARALANFTLGTTLNLFPEARPAWWYLLLLPAFGFPWLFWPLLWMRFWKTRHEEISAGVKFCLFWALPAIALMSLAGARQPQWLLPLVPAFALPVAWLLASEGLRQQYREHLASTMIFPVILAGGLLAVLPGLPKVPYLPTFLWDLSPFVGVGLIGAGVAIGWLPIPSVMVRVFNVTALIVLGLTATTFIVGLRYEPALSVHGVARVLAEREQRNEAVTHIAPYRGEYQFEGRLRRPLPVVKPEDAEAWLLAHPGGYLVSATNAWTPRADLGLRVVLEPPLGETGTHIWQVPLPAPTDAAPAVAP
jgi:4-amino-4-deoxy-L-arabinose transferase-like glycosyltransferase